MPNHYHFVLETRQANLLRLMRPVNGVYTQTAIAKALDLSVSRISRVIRVAEAKGKT